MHGSNCVMVFSLAGKYVGLEDFVEITKKFTQGIAPSPTLDSSREHAGEEEDSVRKSSLDEKVKPSVWAVFLSLIMDTSLYQRDSFATDK